MCVCLVYLIGYDDGHGVNFIAVYIVLLLEMGNVSM